MKTIVVLISNAGSGTNLQAIIDAIKQGQLKIKIAAVISGSADAYGLVRAKKNRIPTVIVKKGDNGEKIVRSYNPDYIVLAGWKKIIPDSLIDTFPNHIINIHPGLIPDTLDGNVKTPDSLNALWNRGLMTEKAVQKFFDTKATYAGSTVHFLSHEFDFGPVLERAFEKIRKNDTVDSLYKRLKKKEHTILLKSLKKLSLQQKKHSMLIG